MTGDLPQWSQYIIFLVLILFILWSFTRRRKSRTTKVDAAMGILSNVNDNLKSWKSRLTDWQSKKKFQTAGWKYYKNRLEFLDASLVTSINEAFTLAEDFNMRIDSAKKNKVMATLQDMPVDKLRVPLTKSKDGLMVWLKANLQSELQNNKRRGFFGF